MVFTPKKMVIGNKLDMKIKKDKFKETHKTDLDGCRWGEVSALTN